jgi:ubiquinone/menaquinone biosynthesis C-methylase UbiE
MPDESMDAGTGNSNHLCNNFLEPEVISKFLGDSFHPGGQKLTLQLGNKLELTKFMKVLDIACGTGTSAMVLNRGFDCAVVGIDLSDKNLAIARERAEKAGFTEKLEFVRSDAEKIEFNNKTFDVVICECALCTFPNKQTTADEMYRVLKSGGRLGITEVLIQKELPEKLKNILSYVTCISSALSTQGYKGLLTETGFRDIEFEDHSHEISKILNKARGLLPGVNLIKNIGNFDIETAIGISIDEIPEMLNLGIAEVEAGNIGYGMFTASKH